jgi:hypothetical protein
VAPFWPLKTGTRPLQINAAEPLLIEGALPSLPIGAELRLTLRGPAQLVFLRTTIALLVLVQQRLHVVPEAPDSAVARSA